MPQTAFKGSQSAGIGKETLLRIEDLAGGPETGRKKEKNKEESLTEAFYLLLRRHNIWR